MRGITFILAFTVLLCGSSIAGSTDSMRNAGLFAFDASPIAATDDSRQPLNANTH